MITFSSEAQSPSGYSQPASISICKNNGPFSVNLIDPPAGGWPANFTLSLEAFIVQSTGQPLPPVYTIPNPWQSFPDCYSSVSGNNPIRLQNPQIGDPSLFTINSYIYNPLTKCYDFVIAVNPSGVHFRIEALSYDLLLDCSVQNGISSTGILIQRWFYNTAPTFLNIPAPAPIPLNLINLEQIPIGPQIINLSGPFNSSQDWDFSYKNQSSTPVSINITYFQTTPCLSYVLDGVAPIRWEVSGNPVPSTSITNIYSPFISVTIPAGNYLHIRQKVKITGCILDCNGTSPTVNFRWKCFNQATPPPLCSSCQEDYIRQLWFFDGVSSYKITRLVEPTDPVALHNTECQGETTTWTFEVTNTGTNDLPVIKVDFENLFPNTFSLVDYNSITVDDFASCVGTCHSVDPKNSIPGYPLGGCGTTSFNDFTDDFSLTISDLPVGETSKISFDVKNFVSADGATFFNATKYYNQWRIQSECSTKCGNLINPDYTNSVVGLNNGISGYSTSNSAPSNDVNLASNFIGPLYITVYPPVFPPPTTPYFATEPIYNKMCFSNIFGNIDDQQAFGFSTNTSTDISGFLKIEIDLDIGLTIGNPMDISFAFAGGTPAQLFPIYGDGFEFPFSSYYFIPTGGPQTVNGGIKVRTFDPQNSQCTLRVYTLYYRLSDLDLILPALGLTRKDLFNQGCLILGFTPCCSALPPPSTYTIKISALPNENCFSFSSNAFAASVASAELCWVPLTETSGLTYVNCPGCVAPGIIIDDYTINRTSLGYPDATNDGLADNTTPIPYFSGVKAQDPLINMYLPYYNNLELNYSTYGDEMEDYLIAHFQDGDNTNGGYQYSDMLADQATLDVIQLYRTFQNSGSGQYDVQITGFDFYIDDPAWQGGGPLPDFADIEDFPSSAAQYPTLLKFTASANDVGDYMIRGTGIDDDKMLFTFSETELQNPPSGTKTFYNGATNTNIDFDVYQQYRLRVRYKVCRNPAPFAVDQADDGEVTDIMYLTGVKRTSVPPQQFNKMPESKGQVCSNLGLCFSALPAPPPPAPCLPCTTSNKISKTSLSDPFVFYCEGFGAKHHFISTIFKNTADYYLVNSSSDDQCRAAIDIKSSAYFAKNTNNNPNNFFKYEYKAPKLFQTQFDVEKPNYWDWSLDLSGNVDITLNSYNCEGWVSTCGIGSPNKKISGVAPNSPIVFDLSTAATFDCLQNNTPAGAFIADEVSAQRIQILLKPENNCIPAQTTADVEDCQITFSNPDPILQPCSQSTNGCSLTFVQDENSGAPDKYRTILPPNPNITAAYSPPIYSSGNGTVTWDFWVWNNPSTLNPFITAAKNVYLALNPFPAFLDASTIQVDYELFNSLNNLQLGGPYTAMLSDNHYLWLTPTVGGGINQLNPNEYFHGQITVDLANCNINPSTFPFLYGWTCAKQTDPPTASNLCFYKNDKSVSLNIDQGLLTANGSSFSPTGYTACSVDPIIATANFQNNSNSVLTLQTPSLFIPSGSIVQANLIGFDLNCTGTFNTNMNSLPTSILIPGECLKIQVEITTNGCHTGPLEMPKVIVPVSDFCGPIIPDCKNDLLYLPSSGASNCTDCFSIIKTATPTSLQPGEQVTYDVEICSNNAFSTVIQLEDVFPPFFMASPAVNFPMALNNIPAIGCTTVTVTGIFIDEGECGDLVNVATIIPPNLSATACVDVACEFPHPGPRVIEIFDDEYLSSFTLSNTLNLYTIHVYDYKTLTIDNSIVFDNCTFIMGSGSSIIVQSQSPGQQITVNMDNSRLYSCPRMWQGIKVTAGTNFYMDASTLRDADKGVYLEDYAHFEITNSFFYDCVVGIYSPPLSAMSNAFGTITGTEFGLNASALKGNYSNINIPITQDAFGTVGRAGILLNNIILPIGDNTQPENIFSNINYGIEIYNSDIDVFNCAFRDIIFDQFYYPDKPYKAGAAIFAIATEPTYHLNVHPIVGATNQTITNANIGVYNEKYNTNVSNLNMDQVNYGVWSERNELCDVMVRNNNINSNNVGIYWFNNDRALRMMAYDNVINSSNICIYAHEYIDDNNANYQITFNSELRSNSSFGGIYLSGVENAQVGYNTIYTDGNGIPSSGSVGIGLYDGRSNSLTCNQVLSTIPHSNLNSFGMKVNISPENTISCNNFNASTTGVFFGGVCNNTIFSVNLMHNNWEGLLLNNVALIDDQVQRGNQWTNVQSPFGAVINSNPSNSKFFVHTPPGSTFSPAVNTGGWFILQSGGTPDNCTINQICNASIVEPPVEASANDLLVATDSLQTIVYSDESRSMARQYLFEKMQSDTLDTWTDSVFVTFYNETAMSPIGELNRVSTTLAHSLDFDLNEYALLSLADSLIKLKSDSIHLLDSLQLISPLLNYKIMRESIISQMNNLRNVVRSILTSKAMQQGILRDSARLINSAIQPAEQPEQNQQIFNEIVALYQEYGDSIIESNYNSLLSIAQQCPFAGGGVVYQARDFLRRVNDSLVYYDDAICLQSGVFREATTSDLSYEEVNLKLIPNPAASTVDIILYPALEEYCRIAIINTMGEVVYSAMGDKNLKIKTVDISNFANGIYMVSIRSGTVFKNEKLIVTR